MRIVPGAKLLIFVLLLAASASAREHWLRLNSPHFEVYTNAHETVGRQVLERFEQVRGVFRNLSAEPRDLPLPVRVFVFASEGDFRPYRPSAASLAFYQSAPERDYIAMRDAGPEAYRVVFHEYTHLVLNHSSVALPKWIEEGTAEFYSTLDFHKGQVQVGLPLRSHLQTLASFPWLTAAQLSAVGNDSPEYNEPGQAGVFYAESWALVHMLHFSDYRAALPRYFDLLKRNTPSAIAFHQAFGRTLEQAIEDLHPYLEAHRFKTMEVAAPPKEEIAITVAPLPLAQARLAGADLLLRVGHDDEARKVYVRLARENPSSVDADVGLATLALHQRRDAEARAHLERALAAGPPSAALCFEYAMLLRDTKAPRAQVNHYLEKTIQLNPHFAEAQFLIGVRESDDGRYGQAVEHLQIAAGILPRQAYFWHALAFAYYKLGRQENSRQAALRALNAAATPEEREMAQAALRLTASHGLASNEPRASVLTPKSWQNLAGDARIDGLLTSIDCLASGARLHIHSAAGDLALTVKDPKRIVLKNSPSASLQFACGNQPPRRVVVDYLAATHEVTAITFR